MKYIWGSLLGGILGLGFINAFIIRFGRAADFFVIFHIILTLALLYRYKPGLREILIFAFLARVALMYWDVYFRNVLMIPHSGLDDGMFFSFAEQVSRDLSLLWQNIRGGYFSKIIGTMFSLTGVSAVLGRYINVLLGLSVVIVVHKITVLLRLKPSSRKTVLYFSSFLPNSIMLSAVFLREIFPTFFVAVSLYFFIRWFYKPRNQDMVLSLVMLAFASMFHSGVIGIFVGYAFAFLFYKHRIRRFRLSPRTVLSFIILAATAYLAATVFAEQLFGQFINADIYETTNYRFGESAYLVNLQINSLWQFLLYTPIRMLYFLIAPMPWDWRGGADIFTFVMDSTLYLYVSVMLFRNRKLFGQRKPLITAIMLMLFGAVVIFGVGVNNTGTAIRHRQKLIPIFLVSMGILIDRSSNIRFNSASYQHRVYPDDTGTNPGGNELR